MIALISLMIFSAIYLIPMVASFKITSLMYEDHRTRGIEGRFYAADRFGMAVVPIINIFVLAYLVHQYLSDLEFHQACRKYLENEPDARVEKIKQMTRAKQEARIKAAERELDIARKELY